MNKALALVTAAAVGAALAGCSSNAVSPTSEPTAATAPAMASSLPPADFAAAVQRPETVLVDVRTPAEFDAGHLAGATNLDVEAADFTTKIATLDKARSYAVYCRSGNRSRTAMTLMLQAGLSKVFDLSGGINAWTAAGGQLVS